MFEATIFSIKSIYIYIFFFFILMFVLELELYTRTNIWRNMKKNDFIKMDNQQILIKSIKISVILTRKFSS